MSRPATFRGEPDGRDAELRRLEREASRGDHAARADLARLRVRTGSGTLVIRRIPALAAGAGVDEPEDETRARLEDAMLEAERDPHLASGVYHDMNLPPALGCVRVAVRFLVRPCLLTGWNELPAIEITEPSWALAPTCCEDIVGALSTGLGSGTWLVDLGAGRGAMLTGMKGEQPDWLKFLEVLGETPLSAWDSCGKCRGTGPEGTGQRCPSCGGVGRLLARTWKGAEE